MEEGLIYLQNGYSKDNEEVKVFFLKTQVATSVIKCSEWQEHLTEPNTWIVDEETAKALEEDNLDCGEEFKKMVNPFAPHLAEEYGAEEHSCPIGHKGQKGPTGMPEEEQIIKDTLDSLKDCQLNIASDSARTFLAREIAKDLRKNGKFLK